MVVISPNPLVRAKTGTYQVAIIRLKYKFADTTFPLSIASPYALDQLNKAAKEIHDFYAQLSYGQLDMPVRVVEVSLSKSQGLYWKCNLTPRGWQCGERNPGTLLQEAAEEAAKGGFDFKGVNGIVLLSLFRIGSVNVAGPTDPWCGDVTALGLHEIPGGKVEGKFTLSYDFECTFPPLPAPGPSGVFWNPWAHEIGHQLEIADKSLLDGPWAGHPSGYASGYELMDSCYPCDESGYGLSGPPVMNGPRQVFAGWLPSSNVVSVEKPSTGTTTTTFVLAPLEQNLLTAKTPQAIKVPVTSDNKLYYIVEARRRLFADSLQATGAGPKGIWDEGVHILFVNENDGGNKDKDGNALYPVKPINACDTTVKGGCVKSKDDPRFKDCLKPGTPDSIPYCWPYVLWHGGDKFNDSDNGIQIVVGTPTGDCTVSSSLTCRYPVTIIRGVTTGHPDVAITPWQTPPMNTYETVDIWVDSSCNGYVTDVGLKGLRYGVRLADGTVIGNGDDPCANHENRLYAHVRNIGDTTAKDIKVHFQVSDPLGVGVTGDWKEIDTTTIPSLAPGDSTDVYVLWTPKVSAPEKDRFKFHTCVRVVIDPVDGEIVTSNNEAQENFDYFEAVKDPISGAYGPIEGAFYIRNTFGTEGLQEPRTFYLNVESQLPADWSYSVADGATSLDLTPDEVREVPVKIIVPPGSPIGQTYLLKVDVATQFTLYNPLIPPPYPNSHQAMEVVGGVVLSAQTVLKANLSLSANLDSAGNITSSGRLDPAHSNVIIALDYTGPDGNTQTRTVTTDSDGHFTDEWTPSMPGAWQVRAIWQGDLDHSSAISDVVAVTVPQASNISVGIVSICQGCTPVPLPFSGVQVGVLAPPIGPQITPFSLSITQGGRITLQAPPTAVFLSQNLQFLEWFSLTDNSVLTTSQTLDFNATKTESLAALYQVVQAPPPQQPPVPQLSLYVSSFGTNDVQRFDGTTGATVGTFASGGGLGSPAGLTFGPDGNLYVSSPASNSVLRFNGTTGAFVDTFASGGNLSNPQGLVFGPDGNLYVSSLNSQSIVRFNGTTGAYTDTFASLPSGTTLELCGPEGLVFGPDGNLYVSCSTTNIVLRFNGANGAFVDVFADGGNSSGLMNPQGLVFGPDGNLYISSFNSNEIKRYNGTTGQFMDNFVSAGSGGLVAPDGLVFGPGGNLYVSSFGTNDVKRFDGASGAFLGDFTSGGGLIQPTFLVFR